MGAAIDPGRQPAQRIMVAEDEFLIALTIEDTLISAGYEVVGIAANFEAAVDLAQRMRPDLAIMDIRLASKRDGIEAAIEIRRRFGVASLFASANLDPHTQARAAEAEPAGWLSKPYTPEKLTAAVEQALAS